MEYRRLGQSGLKVSVYSFGAMTFGDSQWKLGGVDQHTANEMISMCIDAGINLFDTADVYSNGEAEVILGKALEGRRDQVLIATKARGAMGPGPNDHGLSRKHLYDALHGSLKRLNTDYIDLYQVHSFDPEAPLEETLYTLDQFVKDGKVRYIGLSNFAAWQIAKACSISEKCNLTKFTSAQMFYSLVCREIEYEVIPACLDYGLGILVWSPLAGGFLSGKYKSTDAPKGTRYGDREMWFPYFDRDLGFRTLPVLEEIAKKHAVPVSAVSLAWLKYQPAVSSIIIGARNLDQLKQNLNAIDLELDQEDLEKLDQTTKVQPPYPIWMIELQHARVRQGTAR